VLIRKLIGNFLKKIADALLAKHEKKEERIVRIYGIRPSFEKFLDERLKK
jgi:hypothetical protein